MGPDATVPPTAVLHSSAPLRASNAKKYPSRPPLNSRSEAVVRMPPSVTSFILNSHFLSPVVASSARIAPYPSVSFRVLVGGVGVLAPPGIAALWTPPVHLLPSV